MHILHSNTANQSLNREQQLREAVLLTFCEYVPWQYMQLRHVSDRDWQQLLHWLDTSGLALYFLDRITQLGQHHILPPAVISRLQQNLVDNTARTSAMISESTAIHRSFQNAGLSYATLKGFSLWPISVPKLKLRSQLDLDFLMAEESATEARQILEAKGYRLCAISGRSWEFKANANSAHTLKDLYKATPQRSVELHIEINTAGNSSLLARTEKLCFYDVCTPVLRPVDLFLGQGMHLYKHLCSEFSRTAHLIEFRRHIVARYKDEAFWMRLRELAEDDTKASVGLGFATLLISRTMGDFAPKAFTCWTVDRLPAPVRLWVELYGCRTVLAGSPGSKLYLLLQKELQEAGLPAKRTLRQALLPRRLPPAIACSSPGETLSAKVQRHRRQVHFILFRLRFHIVEGLRYLGESVRWRKHVSELKR